MKIVYTLLLSALSFACSPEPAEAATLSGEVGYTSDYLFRGQSQTLGDPALQGSINLQAKGLYVNAWASQVDFDNGADTEIDYTIGYALPLFKDKVVIEVGAIAYTYTNDNVSFANDTKEVFLGLDVGFVGAKIFQEIGSNSDNRYYEGTLAISEFVPVPFGINLEALASYADNDDGANVTNVGVRVSKSITDNLYASVEYTEEYENWAGGLYIKF